MAEITKILTEKYGYKNIPYASIHDHIINHKIRVLSSGMINSQITKLELYIREMCDQHDEKKFGRVPIKKFVEAL